VNYYQYSKIYAPHDCLRYSLLIIGTKRGNYNNFKQLPRQTEKSFGRHFRRTVPMFVLTLQIFPIQGHRFLILLLLQDEFIILGSLLGVIKRKVTVLDSLRLELHCLKYWSLITHNYALKYL
jgi:hypothetical protein